jgi:hypothetical protein
MSKVSRFGRVSRVSRVSRVRHLIVEVNVSDALRVHVRVLHNL